MATVPIQKRHFCLLLFVSDYYSCMTIISMIFKIKKKKSFFLTFIYTDKILALKSASLHRLPVWYTRSLTLIVINFPSYNQSNIIVYTL